MKVEGGSRASSLREAFMVGLNVSRSWPGVDADLANASVAVPSIVIGKEGEQDRRRAFDAAIQFLIDAHKND